MNSELTVDIDAIIQSIYGSKDLLESLSNSSFQIPLHDALTSDDKRARVEFLEANHGFLVGSIQALCGTIRILSDALLKGEIEIVPVGEYKGSLELEQMQDEIIDMLRKVDDLGVMRKILLFTKTLIS